MEKLIRINIHVLFFMEMATRMVSIQRIYPSVVIAESEFHFLSAQLTI